MRPHHRLRTILPAALALIGACTLSACMKRHDLNEALLDEKLLDDEIHASTIRVYVDRKLIVSRKDRRDAGTRVDNEINTLGRKKTLHEIIGRWTRGRLIALDRINGQRRLWVAFDQRCAHKRCAYAFVLVEDGERFRLMNVPNNPVFDRYRVYGRDWAISRRLKRGLVESYADANPVFRGHGYRDKLITVELQYIERYKPHKTIIRRVNGVKRHDDAPRELLREHNEQAALERNAAEGRGDER